MREHDLKYGELRTVNEKNFVFWNTQEVNDFQSHIIASQIELVAAATPLFKWYIEEHDPEIIHDSFGFNPRINDAQKRRIIAHTINVASNLGIPRLRIFSGLGVTADSGITFAKDPLLAYALECADRVNIDLYLENEPVCRVHDKEQIINVFKNNYHPRLKFWLDIANLTELGEDIDNAFIIEMAPRLSYLHIKDYTISNGLKEYVPAGEGEVDYNNVLAKIFKYCDNDLVLTVETHAQKSKIEMSARAISGTRLLLSKQGITL